MPQTCQQAWSVDHGWVVSTNLSVFPFRYKDHVVNVQPGTTRVGVPLCGIFMQGQFTKGTRLRTTISLIRAVPAVQIWCASSNVYLTIPPAFKSLPFQQKDHCHQYQMGACIKRPPYTKVVINDHFELVQFISFHANFLV